MKRKSRPLITGGLLGLAGLGLLPWRAEAAPEGSAVAPDPSLGTALADDPHPVVAPEPSAQTTAPQIDGQGSPQPAWTPEGDQAVMAAAVPQPATPPAADGPQPALSAPEPSAPAGSVLERLDSDLTTAPATLAETSAIAPAPAPAPAAAVPAIAPPERADAAVPDAQGAIASPPLSSSAPPVGAEITPETVGVAAAARLAEVSLIKPAAQPTQGLQPQNFQPLEAEPRLAPVPAGAAASSAVTATAPVAIAPSRAAPEMATLRSRATEVRALLRDLRTAYGIETPAPAGVSQPETLRPGPQLPPLPARSPHRRPVVAQSGNQTDKIAVPIVAPTVFARARQTAAGVQLPSLAGRPANVALALPNPQPILSPQRATPSLQPRKLAAPLPTGTVSPAATAQAAPPTSANQLRDELRVAPLTTVAEAAPSFPPSPNAGIPSAFGANWGDAFFSASLAGADRSRPEADGSLSMGFGLGDSRRVVGVELAYNLLSIRQFGENGGFDAKVHRQVYSSDETQVAAAVGLNNFASYGANAGGSESSLYGVVTAAHLLQPDHPDNRLPITASLGLGGGSFSGEGSDVGVIAGVGLQVHPQFSVNTAWSGVGLNVGASIVPVSTLPLTLNLLYGDIGNNTRAGSVAVLSIGYGFNFGPRF